MKVVLSIAGSDCSGGAGIQADLKTFEAFGVFGTTVLTVLTAQNTTGVQGIHPVPADFVAAQLGSILSDFQISAIKIGMLYSAEVIEALRKILRPLDIPIVLDPVCISKAGSPLLSDDALEPLRHLCREVSLITPNLHEARRLFGYEIGESDSLKAIVEHPVPILIKNHIAGTSTIDLLYTGGEKKVFPSEYIDSTSQHGTGCSYSSAIAANLALGYPLEEAIERSKRFITEAIRTAPRIGKGSGPINHKAGGEHVA
jgi:hydroxymethylpyrimidine/phosphomethylpyrimidine kinase